MTDFRKRGRPITPKYIQTHESCKSCGYNYVSGELQQVGWRTLRKLKASRHNNTNRLSFTIEVTVDCQGKGHEDY